MQQNRTERWQLIIQQISTAYRALAESEKQWIDRQLEQIETLQLQLDQLFQQGNGGQACCNCQGDCCAKGHNHLTLANLLSYLRIGELPPVPDFSRTCPFLGDRGCLLPAANRPYPCISFVCDIIETAFTPADVDEFYRLERQLRSLYLELAERYTGGGMTGLLLQDERLAGSAFLERKSDPSAIATV